MIDLATIWPWVVGAVALVTVVGMLHTLATSIRESVRLHDLHVRVAALRIKYLAHLKAVELGDDVSTLATDTEGLAEYLRKSGMPGRVIGGNDDVEILDDQGYRHAA
ncbi:MAG: hypothetical protein KF866_06200 [Phycisphaeraceae bacterium]|nr:hypothetical protein [Phycisphaeraceae bacterium]